MDTVRARGSGDTVGGRPGPIAALVYHQWSRLVLDLDLALLAVAVLFEATRKG